MPVMETLDNRKLKHFIVLVMYKLCIFVWFYFIYKIVNINRILLCLTEQSLQNGVRSGIAVQSTHIFVVYFGYCSEKFILLLYFSVEWQIFFVSR